MWVPEMIPCSSEEHLSGSYNTHTAHFKKKRQCYGQSATTGNDADSHSDIYYKWSRKTTCNNSKFQEGKNSSQTQELTPVISRLRRQRQKDGLHKERQKQISYNRIFLHNLQYLSMFRHQILPGQ